MGTSNGGSLLIRTCPSTISVSLAKAFSLSLLRALATALSRDLRRLRLIFVRSSSTTSSTSARAYQTSSAGMAAN